MIRFYQGLSCVWIQFPGWTIGLALSSAFLFLCEGGVVLMGLKVPGLDDLTKLRPWAVSFALLILLRGAAQYLATLFSARLKMEAATWVRGIVLENYRQMSLPEFYRVDAGSLMNTLTSQTECFLAALEGCQSLFRSAGLMGLYLGILGMTWAWDHLVQMGRPFWILGILLGIISFILHRWIGNQVALQGNHLNRIQNEMASLALDEIESMPVVHAFDLFSVRRNLYEQASRALSTHFVYLKAWSHLGQPVIYGVSVLIFLGMIFWETGLSNVPWMSWVSLALVFYRLQGWVSQFHFSLTQMREYQPHAKIILEYLEAPEILLPPEKKPMGFERFRGEKFQGIKLENVSFEFQSGKPVVEDLSFEIRPGERVVLVGPSGSGKTTVAHLAAGLLCPTRGEVFFNSSPMSQVSGQDRSQIIGFAFEKTYVFNDTVEFNIRCGRPLRDDQVQRAAHAAGVLDLIESLPQGFKTRIGYQGLTLSNGQRQRVVLARALAGEPSLLILDEATSALDRLTEQCFESFLRERQEISILMISHRFESMDQADRILVMQAGRIQAQGRHLDLMESCPLYQKMQGGCEYLLKKT